MMRAGDFCAAGAFAHLAPEITTMSGRVKCWLFVYAGRTVYNPPDKFPLPAVYLLFSIRALKASG